MERKYKKISTEVGYIEAKRDAIHLDLFRQKNNTMTLSGAVYAEWCEKKAPGHKWYEFCLTVKGVKEYQAINIEEYYKKKIDTPSTFSEVLDTSSDQTDLRTIIIETYDWAYIIVCMSYQFTITGCI